MVRFDNAKANQIAHTLPLLIPVFVLLALAATTSDAIVSSGMPEALAALVVALVRVSQGITFWSKNERTTRDEATGWWGMWIALVALVLAALAITVAALSPVAIVIAIVSVALSMWSMFEARAIKRQFWDPPSDVADGSDARVETADTQSATDRS